MVRRPSHHAAERERFVEDLLAIMTVEEKAGQLVALPVPGADNTAEHVQYMLTTLVGLLERLRAMPSLSSAP